MTDQSNADRSLRLHVIWDDLDAVPEKQMPIIRLVKGKDWRAELLWAPGQTIVAYGAVPSEAIKELGNLMAAREIKDLKQAARAEFGFGEEE